jgi:hypothetical protein
MRHWSICSLIVLRVSMVWVKSGVHLTVRYKVVFMGLARQLSSPRGRTWRPRQGLSRFLGLLHPWSSAGRLLLTAGSSIWRLPELPEDVLKVKVKATALLRSRLVGPVPGVLPAFLSCHSFCFSAGVNWSNSASEKCLLIMWVCLLTSDWGKSPFWHLSEVWGPYPWSCLHG